MYQQRKSLLLILLWCLLTSAMVGTLAFKFMGKSITFDSNILNVLDLGSEIDDLTKAAAAPFETKALLLVQNASDKTSKSFIDTLSKQLLTNNVVLEATSAPNQNIDLNALVEIYSHYPLAFLSKTATKARDADDYTYLIDNYMRLLSGPSNPLVSLTINKAPLLNLADWFSEKVTPNNWQQDGDFIYVEHNHARYYPLFLEFSYAATQMDQVVATIAQLDTLIQQNTTQDMAVYRSGFIFHSAAITSQAHFETQLFGGLSMLGVLALTLISFRSIHPLVSVSLLIGSAMLAGMLALTLIFEKIHILSLVFAVSLIGIAVDYGYHILLTAKHTGLKNHTLNQYIAPAILVSGGTTLVSYLFLLLLPIPLLQQVAVFVAAGLTFTIFTGLTLITHWPWQAKNQATNQAKNTQAIAVKSYKFSQPIKGFRILLSLLVLLSFAALPNWFFQDNINVFNSSPEHLVNNERLVNQVIGNQQYPRFIYTKADNHQQVLHRFEKIRRAIHQKDAGQFELRGIDQWLPSIHTQQTNRDWLQAGLTSKQLSPITEFMTPDALANLSTKSAQYLSIEQLPNQIVNLFPHITEQNGEMVGILSYMGPVDEKWLADIQQQLDFPIHYFDQPAKFTTALTTLRHYLLYFLAAAALALLALMSIRYGFLRGLKLAMIPIVTAFSALALSQFVLGYVTIFNLLGCILIIALSVDYVVFLSEHGRQLHVIKAISLSAATSGLAFGMFVFSSTPAILQFGLTILVGILIAWSLCLLLPPSFLKTQTEVH